MEEKLKWGLLTFEEELAYRKQYGPRKATPANMINGTLVASDFNVDINCNVNILSSSNTKNGYVYSVTSYGDRYWTHSGSREVAFCPYLSSDEVKKIYPDGVFAGQILKVPCLCISKEKPLYDEKARQLEYLFLSHKLEKTNDKIPYFDMDEDDYTMLQVYKYNGEKLVRMVGYPYCYDGDYTLQPILPNRQPVIRGHVYYLGVDDEMEMRGLENGGAVAVRPYGNAPMNRGGRPYDGHIEHSDLYTRILSKMGPSTDYQAERQQVLPKTKVRAGLTGQAKEEVARVVNTNG